MEGFGARVMGAHVGACIGFRLKLSPALCLVAPPGLLYMVENGRRIILSYFSGSDLVNYFFFILFVCQCPSQRTKLSLPSSYFGY